MTDDKYMRSGMAFAVGKLVEECGELQAALGKTLRWGWNEYNPEVAVSDRETNEEWVRREMADVEGAILNLKTELDKRGI